ncbi:hypothetical protein EG329_005886 [Mollisiaceae sp. DMI_Dod_QoI]|nr:hypothetical protein EG329_005886 [Helotiales sp. DMI_Dod_QoI]
MSGVEALGVAASAIQLADFGLRISNTLLEVFDRLHEYPARLHSYVDEIKKLIETAHLVEENSGLQTPTVHAHIKTTLAAAIELQTTLERLAGGYSQKSRTYRCLQIVVKGAFEEKQLIARFESLERQKSDLIFCISVVHSDAIAEIQGGVALLVDIMPLIFGNKKTQDEKEKHSPPPQDKDRSAMIRLRDTGFGLDGSQISGPESRPPTSTRMACDTQNQENNTVAVQIRDNEVKNSKGSVGILGLFKKGESRNYDVKGNKITDESRAFIGVVVDNKSARAMAKGLFND